MEKRKKPNKTNSTDKTGQLELSYRATHAHTHSHQRSTCTGTLTGGSVNAAVDTMHLTRLKATHFEWMIYR